MSCWSSYAVNVINKIKDGFNLMHIAGHKHLVRVFCNWSNLQFSWKLLASKNCEIVQESVIYFVKIDWLIDWFYSFIYLFVCLFVFWAGNGIYARETMFEVKGIVSDYNNINQKIFTRKVDFLLTSDMEMLCAWHGKITLIVYQNNFQEYLSWINWSTQFQVVY